MCVGLPHFRVHLNIFEDVHASVRSVRGPSRRVLFHHPNADFIPLYGKLRERPNLVYQPHGLCQDIPLSLGAYLGHNKGEGGGAIYTNLHIDIF